MTERLLTSIAQLEQCTTMSALRAIVRTIVTPYGYDLIVMFSVIPSREAFIDRIYWIEGRWFNDLCYINAETYIQRRPIIQHFLESDKAFFWQKTVEKGEEHYRIINQPNGEGIHGLQIPVFGKTGIEGALSLGGRAINSTSQVRILLTMMGMAAFHAARRIMMLNEQSQQAYLSAREKEVLSLVGKGLRQIDVARTLNLSERTIENHLRRIRLRLKVSTTAQAIVSVKAVPY